MKSIFTRIRSLRSLLSVAAALLVVSCTKDPLPATGPASRDGALHFSVTQPDDRNAPSSRAAASPAANAPQYVGVLKLQGDDPADSLFLHVSVSEGIEGVRATAREMDEGATRAAPVTAKDFHDSFGVFAYLAEPEEPDNGYFFDGVPAPTALYMDNVKVTKGASDWATQYHWPGSRHMITFMAYAPYENSNISFTYAQGSLSSPVDGSYLRYAEPSLTYTVPEDVSEQTDFVFAATGYGPGDYNKPVPLLFFHALTAVKFVAADDLLGGKMTIKKIELQNIYSENTGRMQIPHLRIDNLEDQYVPWLVWSKTDLSKETTFSSGTLDFQATPGSGGEKIVSGETTFMLLPLSNSHGDAQIVITYNDGYTAGERTLSVPISTPIDDKDNPNPWQMGRTVTYKISSSSIDVTPTLEVTPPADFTYEGGTQQWSVTSCWTVSDATGTATAPLGWTAEFYDEQKQQWTSARPDWLTNFPTSGGGDTDAVSIDVGVAAQTGVTSNPHNDALRNAVPVYNYDLSTRGGTTAMNTANCYIINAPGTYFLPLVYGNAIKDGAANVAAYTSQAPAGDNVLSTFVNHLGNEITSPIINLNSGCSPKDAVLVWQDEEGLVVVSPEIAYARGPGALEPTDPEILGGGLESINPDTSDDAGIMLGILYFTIPEETCKQGNAVIAVRDQNDQIMWSWHIWVTDWLPGTDLKTVTYNGTPYTMMPVNLGWCDGDRTDYEGRSVKVKFTQTGTGTTKEITINQIATSVQELGNSPYYQWGRKDPIVAALGMYRSKAWYDATGASLGNVVPTSQDNMTIAIGIQNPRTFFGYYDKEYDNLWAVDHTSTSQDLTTSTKTIYDPCPEGYKVALSNSFRPFTTKGNGSTNKESEINGTWNDTPPGMNFYCNEGTVFFPAVGERGERTSNSYYYRIFGEYWTAERHSSGQYFCLSIRGAIEAYNSPLYISACTYMPTTYAYSVRPMVDD